MENFIILSPEIFLATIVIVLQVIAVSTKISSHAIIRAVILLGILLITLISCFNYKAVAFANSFVIDKQIIFFKGLIFAISLMIIIIYHDFCKISKAPFQMEFTSLILLSVVGIFISISSRDLLLLFCGLELSSIPAYALAAYGNNIKSSEAGLKYFILGSLMSCIMLFGFSYIYGYSGSIQFENIGQIVAQKSSLPIMIGLVMLVFTILFKLSAAPAHFWVPDVYEGSPIVSMAYFATCQKLAALIILFNIINNLLINVPLLSMTIMKYSAILSMIIGTLGALRQQSLKRLIAYSSILNIGYVLIGVCLGNSDGEKAAYVNIIVYLLTLVGFLSCIIALFGESSDDATFDHLKGLAAERKTLAATITILMFSFIGMPPFAGFFGKYYILYSAIKASEINLAIIGLLSSVVSAFYYLKIIKHLYFDKPVKNKKIIPTHNGLLFVSLITTSFVLFFFIFIPSYIF